MSKLMLNIGCGDRKRPGFVNIDIAGDVDLRHDVTKGVPYPDGSVDVIFSEHFLEHLTQRDGLNFLRECRRVLRPEGIVRIAMPDLDELVGRYGQDDWRCDGDMFRLGFDWVDNSCEMLNIAMRDWGYQWVYNEEELRRVANLAGLLPRGRKAYGVSEIEELNGLECRPASKLIMEFATRGVRPAGPPPKVSILIPAYRAQFLRAALDSALSQAYPDLEIVVCDDCPTYEVREVVEELESRDRRIRYVRNDPPKGPLYNYVACFNSMSGDYVQFLNDDDVLGQGWVSEAAGVLADRPGVTLVTCARRHIDESGQPVNPTAPVSFARRPGIYEGKSLLRFLVALGHNCIGEPSACMFRQADIAMAKPHLISLDGVVVRGLGDVAMWATLLSKGDLAFVTATHCGIRVHPNQWQQDEEFRPLATGAWRLMRQHVARIGLYHGVLGRNRLPNPWLVLRGYRWKPFEGGNRWRIGRPRIAQATDFLHRVGQSSMALLLKQPT